jgi:hypothetical protein
MFIIWRLFNLVKNKKDKKDKKKDNNFFTAYVYNWESGSLSFDKFEFDSLAEAQIFAQTQSGIIKVYDSKGRLVHFEKRENDDNPY